MYEWRRFRGSNNEYSILNSYYSDNMQKIQQLQMVMSCATVPTQRKKFQSNIARLNKEQNALQRRARVLMGGF